MLAQNLLTVVKGLYRTHEEWIMSGRDMLNSAQTTSNDWLIQNEVKIEMDLTEQVEKFVSVQMTRLSDHKWFIATLKST